LSVILICTWGAKGAAAVKLIDNTSQELEWAKCDVVWNPSESSKTKVVDTIGAGDTFIAGMIYCLTNHPNTTLEQKLGYAIQIASRKVYQDGFGGLGKAMKGVLG
jgi:ketohexokinase